MVNYIRKCAVLNCENKNARRQFIPTDPVIKATWLERIGNQALLDIAGEEKIRNYVIYQSHFSQICIEESGKLRKNSLPVINVPGFPGPPSRRNSFVQVESELTPLSKKPIKFLKEQIQILTKNKLEEEVFLKVMKPLERVYFGKKGPIPFSSTMLEDNDSNEGNNNSS